MKKSIFPNGVRVDHSALRYTESSKSEEILRGRVDWTSRGVLSGFTVSVNVADSTLIDVLQGSGYTPSGEFIETTSDYYSIALDDYTAGVVNYVCVIYTETNTYNQPHETNGATYPTRSEMAWRVRVHDAVAYAALPPTDANLANDARDRIIVIAAVTANGAGVPLTSNSITLPIDSDAILYSVPSELTTITGVMITSISPDTGPGTGTLGYTYAVGPVYTFTWTSLTGGLGAATVVNADGYWNIPDGLGEYIRCYIVLSQLPVAGTFPMTESVAITNLYYQALPRLTGEDTYHRNLIGTGVISRTNAHGMSISDLAGGSLPQLEEHQDVMHCNGIWRDSAVNILLTSVNTLPAVADTLNINVLLASDLFYINGNKLSLVNNSTIPFTPWSPDWGVGTETMTSFFEIYVTDTSDVKAHKKAVYPALRNLTGTWIVDMSPSHPAGSYNLAYTVAGLNTILTWDGGVGVPLLTTDFGVAGNSRVIRLFDAEGVNWIDLWVNLDDVKAAATDDQFNNTSPGPVTDPITVTASLDWDANMQIASLCYWYDASTPKGKLGYAPNTITRRVIDKRSFGTLCTDNISDTALQNLVYHPEDELHYSGVLLSRGNPSVDFGVTSTAALGMTIRGGNYYCRGRRLQAIGDSVTLIDNVTNLIWLDMDGNYNVINVTAAPYSGDLQAAMRYVLGSSSYIPAADDSTHSTDMLDPPERGVILYHAVTAGGAITYYEDMMRNVNGPVDSWSVAQRHNSNDSVNRANTRLAAFDSLNSAFEYAALSNKLDGTTIRIVGFNEIENRRILQPEGVRVVGSKQNPNIAFESSTTLIGYGDTNGVWCLSQGCTVSNVKVEANIANVAVFGVGSSLVSDSDNIIIKGCYFNCAAYTTGSYFVRLNEAGFGGASINNLTVKDNTVIVGVGFVTYINNTVDFNNINIYHNNIEFSGTAALYALSLDANATSHGIRFSNNYVLGSYGVYLKDYENCDISHNSFVLGDSAGGTVIGINLDTVTKSTVSDNVFSEAAGNTSTSMTGIKIKGLTNVGIDNNVITNYHYGIYDSISTASVYISINDNKIIAVDNGAGAGGVGIFIYGYYSIISNNFVYADAVGIGCGPDTGTQYTKIIGNNVRVTTKNGGLLSAYNIGIAGCYGIAAATNSIDVDVENNQVKLTGVATVLADASACIYINQTDGFTIKNNTVSVSGTTTLSGGTGAWQIYAGYPLDDSNFSVSGNKVDNRNHVFNPSPLWGIYVVDVGGAGIIGTVDGNLIDGSSGTGDPAIDELYVSCGGGAGGTWMFVSHNVISDLTKAAANVPNVSFVGAGVITADYTAAGFGNNARFNSVGIIDYV